jgi:hypothetical protein
MLQVKNMYLYGRKVQVGNGVLSSFWGDSWCSISFCICNEYTFTVVAAATMGWNFTFTRCLTPNLALKRDGLVYLLTQITLNQVKDVLLEIG